MTEDTNEVFPPEVTAGLVWLRDVEEEPLTWTWRGYIPDGKVTVLDGDPGLGKSVLWCDLVSRISRGTHMPNNEPLEVPLTCLIVSAEDDIAGTLKPRLRAAGADMNRVATLGLQCDERGQVIPFTVPEEVPRLRAALAESRAKFVV